MITCKIDTSSLNRTLEAYSAASKKGMKEVVKDFGKRVVRQLYTHTPPSGPTNKGTKARKALEERIEKDIMGSPAPSGDVVFQWSEKHQKTFAIEKTRQKIPGMFVAVNRMPKGATAVNPAQHVSQFRMKKGKAAMYRNWNGERPIAKLSEVRRLVRAKKGKVGRLAAGWNAAAASVNLRPPAWISRMGTGEGAAVYRHSGWRYVATYTNRVPYDQQHMQTVAASALRYAENGMKRQTNAMEKKFNLRKRSA